MNRALRNLIHRTKFRDAAGGSVTLVLSLAIGVLMMGMGMAIDYQRATATRSAMQKAADAAALAAARDPDLKEGATKKLIDGLIEANMMYSSAAAVVRDTSAKRTNGDSPSVVVTIDAYVKPMIMSIFGIKTLPVSVKSTAQIAPNHSVLYAVVDMSGSMGLAANPAARTDLEALTRPYQGTGCMFACHYREGWEPPGTTSYEMAKAANIPLREDVLNEQFHKLVDIYLDPTDPNVSSGRRKMGVYGFSDRSLLLTSPTNSTSEVMASLDNFPGGRRWNTLYQASFNEILPQLGAQGDGSTATPKKTILLVTDGAGWYREMGTSAKESGVIDLALCNSIKSSGYTLAIVDVKYWESKNEYWFETVIRPFYNLISPTLKSCASPGFYFQATDSDTTSLGKVFTDAANALRSPLVISN